MKNGEDKASDKCNPDDNNFLQNKNAGFTSDLPLGLSLAETSTKSLQLHQRIGTEKSSRKNPTISFDFFLLETSLLVK